MRRSDGSENFSREWDDYENGFASLNKEFWAGNYVMFIIGNSAFISGIYFPRTNQIVATDKINCDISVN
jgi:hypothetical protein